jgi:NADPH:quinone reductase-like Zn-dependent oxidoreductase
MKAASYTEYGSADVVRLKDVERPVPKDDEVLIRVCAASVNAYDCHFMHGEPRAMRLATGLRRPKDGRLGVDVAGRVETAGKNVTEFKPGDEVFGVSRGAFAEYACPSASRVALKPLNVSFEQAAATPIAGITALQGLRDKGEIKPGQKVLINGAGGGVGTFAVQIAKLLGAEVTAVTSTKNLELVRSLGADHTVDYTREDFTSAGKRYDAILDVGANHSWSDIRRSLTNDGKWLFVGAVASRGWLRPLGTLVKALAQSPFVSQKVQLVPARVTRDDLVVMSEFLKAGKIKPAIEKTYSLADVAHALRHVEQGHARGKVVITIP